jgi:hypothetical protein
MGWYSSMIQLRAKIIRVGNYGIHAPDKRAVATGDGTGNNRLEPLVQSGNGCPGKTDGQAGDWRNSAPPAPRIECISPAPARMLILHGFSGN